MKQAIGIVFCGVILVCLGELDASFRLHGERESGFDAGYAQGLHDGRLPTREDRVVNGLLCRYAAVACK